MLRGPWDWHTKGPLYAGAAATVAVLLTVMLLVVPGDGAGDDRLVSDAPTPGSSEWLQEIFGGKATATVAPGSSNSPSTEPVPFPSSTSTPARPEPVPAARLLTTGWLEAVLGRGRARWSYGGEDPVDGNPTNWHKWWWLGETEVQETVEDVGTVDGAKDRFAHWAETVEQLGPATRPDVGDAALTASRSTALMTDTRALLRVGHLVVQLSWRESGRVEPGPTQLRLLAAAAARVRGDRLPSDQPAPTPESAPGAGGYLGQPDVREEFWSGDLTTDESPSPFRCTPTPEGQDVLALARPAVVRHWIDASSLSTWFARAEAAEHDTAAASFESCRRRLGAVAIEGIGDAAFCASWDNDQEQLCMVRSGDTYFVFRAARGYPISSAEAFRAKALPLLRTALARDPGA